MLQVWHTDAKWLRATLMQNPEYRIGLPEINDLEELSVMLSEQLANWAKAYKTEGLEQGDASCILYPGDHHFVKKESFVVYQKARIEDADKVLRSLKDGKLVPQDPMDSAVFARICKGLEDSRLTPPKLLRFYLAATGRAENISAPVDKT